MIRLLQNVASLKIAVFLLVALLVGLAAGTIIESARGTEVAGRIVYYSWWLITLQAALAVNVLAAVIVFFPWGRQRIGFLTTHGALIVILLGAAVSFFFKTEGQLGLWEGQSGNEIVDYERDGRISKRTTLPFSVRLLDFHIDYYPGTMRPAGFRSDVEIIDPDGKSFEAAIWMNNELTHKGWSLFQSSYRQEAGREATVLSVSKDPGQPIVFVGYILLVLGMCVVLATRISQAKTRATPAAAARRGPGKSTMVVGLLAGLLNALASADPASAADQLIDTIRRLPVQHDGRVMPFDTLAREGVWQVTGKRSWDGEDPVATVMWWMFDPQAAVRAPIVDVGGADLARSVGLPGGTEHASFAQLANNPRLLQLMSQARRAAADRQPRPGVLADAEKLDGRLTWMRRFINLDLIRSLPASTDANAAWAVPEASSAADLAALANGPRPGQWPQPSVIKREITYNAARPTRLAWIVLLAALLLSILAWQKPSRLLDALALGGLVAGLAVMTWGIGIRWAVGDRIPAANMYESLLFLAWGVGLFAVLAFAFTRNRLVVLNAGVMATLTMTLTDLLPIDPFIHPVPPVLAGTPWLAIHVPIIMVSYSVLALGVVVAHMQIGFAMFAPEKEDVIDRMADLLYWYMMVGSILLITGILTGSIWAASSWGRYWGWDPKEVWSLVAFLAYVAILHARWDRMIGPFGVAAISILAFQTILMTYLGVNFVLSTGLHSYGFGDSPVVKWMVIVGVAEAAFLGWSCTVHRYAQRAG